MDLKLCILLVYIRLMKINSCIARAINPSYHSLPCYHMLIPSTSSQLSSSWAYSYGGLSFFCRPFCCLFFFFGSLFFFHKPLFSFAFVYFHRKSPLNQPYHLHRQRYYRRLHLKKRWPRGKFFCLRAQLLGNMPHLFLMTNELSALSLYCYDTS